jgi:CheY-like chemotaxis protein
MVRTSARWYTDYVALTPPDRPAQPRDRDAADPRLSGSYPEEPAVRRVLVVEDEDAVRRLTTRVLAAAGYDVLTAGSPGEALTLAAAEERTIDLLVTDVIMPSMTGPALARRLVAARPKLRVLYVSGYTNDALADRGILPEGTHLLEKPFLPAELAHRARAALAASH